MWLGDHYYQTMGGLSYADIYDFSEHGLQFGTEKKVRLEYHQGANEEYNLIVGESMLEFPSDWRTISTEGIQVMSITVDGTLEKAYERLLNPVYNDAKIFGSENMQSDH